MGNSAPSVLPTVEMPGVDAVLAEWQREATRFAWLRLSRNLGAGLQVLRATNPVELLRVQQEWGLQLVSDYQDEARKVSELLAASNASAQDIQDTAALVG